MSTTSHTPLELSEVMAAAEAADAAERVAYASWAELDRARAGACAAAQRAERALARDFEAAVGTPAELAELEASLVALENAVDRAFRSRDES